MRPNWKKDTRKHRTADGRCSISGCPYPSVLTYYGYGLCERCMNYYLAENMDSWKLKQVLRIKEPKKESSLEDIEEEIFSQEEK